jgi:hypothetical protein
MGLLTLQIHPSDFGPVRRVAFESDHFRAERFVYDSGVAAIQIWNERGSIVVLPFRGQQIWSAEFDGVDLKMVSQFDEPTASFAYLESYGAFFIHCGITAMGDPGPEDTHVLHGELPAAPFGDCKLDLSSDGATLGISAMYRHRVAFETDYLFVTRYSLDSRSAMVLCEIRVSNMRAMPLGLMYLGHINFRPVEQSRRLTNQQSEIQISRTDEQYIREHLSGLMFSPGATGRCLQVHPDGAADHVWQKPAELPYAVRWICETDRERAAGIALPATCLTTGRTAEHRAGRVPSVPGYRSWNSTFGFGRLSTDETRQILSGNPDLIERGSSGWNCAH